MIDNNNLTGNISTVAVWIYVLLAPYISQYISQDVFLAIFGLILAVWSSANPNTFEFLKNNIHKCNCSCDSQEIIMNNENESTIEEDGC